MASDETEATPVDPFRGATPPELAAVRPGEDLDWGRIEAYLRSHLPSELDTGGAFELLVPNSDTRALGAPDGSVQLLDNRTPAFWFAVGDVVEVDLDARAVRLVGNGGGDDDDDDDDGWLGVLWTVDDNLTGGQHAVEAVQVSAGGVYMGGVVRLDDGSSFHNPVRWNVRQPHPRLTVCPVSYTHLTLPTNREV